jgi:hypothetical protein
MGAGRQVNLLPFLARLTIVSFAAAGHLTVQGCLLSVAFSPTLFLPYRSKCRQMPTARYTPNAQLTKPVPI